MRKIKYCLLIMQILLLCSPVALAKDYSYEVVNPYLYHHFEFDREETRVIAKGPYKAKEYAAWVLNEIEDLASGMSIGVARVTGKAVLEFKLTSMARLSEREGKEILQVEIRSYDDGSGNWTLELYDSVADAWKKLTE